MKYKPIFGDQSNFDKADADAVCAYYPGDGFSLLSFISEDKLKKLTRPTFLLINIVAMRRIIHEPKRWTVEDQKAGRLPEVGAKVDGGKVVFVNGFNVVTELKRGAVIVSSSKTFLNTFKPIESPEEKAEREEDEFVASITKCTSTDGYSSGYIEGIRAVYRKLKGGE